jgi:hypothetical protein
VAKLRVCDGKVGAALEVGTTGGVTTDGMLKVDGVAEHTAASVTVTVTVTGAHELAIGATEVETTGVVTA